MKLQAYLSSTKLCRREQELLLWLDSEDSLLAVAFPARGPSCLSWDISEVKALLTVSNAIATWQKISMKSIKQTHRKLLSSFQHSHWPFSQWEAEAGLAASAEGGHRWDKGVLCTSAETGKEEAVKALCNCSLKMLWGSTLPFHVLTIHVPQGNMLSTYFPLSMGRLDLKVSYLKHLPL